MHRKLKKKYLRPATRTMRAAGTIFCTPPPHFSDESCAPSCSQPSPDPRIVPQNASYL